MISTRRTLMGVAAAAAILPARSRAQSRPLIKIGVMNDLSGPYRDATGLGSSVCAQYAVKQFGDAPFEVQILTADHQNKPDVGASIARQWCDRDGVDVILDVPTSSVSLAVNSIAKEKNKLYLNTGGGTGDLTGTQCTPVTIHWTYDTYMLSRSSATQITKLGGKRWYFITADYVFGQQLARDAMTFVKANGGTVLGETRYPFPQTTDFSSQLLEAQAAGADVIGFANAGSDTINCIKQAHEFGLASKVKLAAMLMEMSDVKAVGTEIGQGLYLTQTYYWDQNEGTRSLARAVQPKMPGNVMPTMIHAGCYGVTLHYLKALRAVGTQHAGDGAAICSAMKKMPTEDEAFGKNTIREDGLALLPAYLYQIKTSAESTGPWDLQKLVATTPAPEAWKPLAEEGCPLVKS
jgi:branched-chain amino acid transport system substrate-binding protein